MRFIRVENTPGIASQNFYQVYAYAFNGSNVALNKAATSFSVLSASYGPANAVGGAVGEGSFFNSLGSTSAEYWMVDLGAPTQVASVAFVNRAPVRSGSERRRLGRRYG